MKRLLYLFGGGIVVLCLAAGGFWYWINIPPQIKIPTPVMPRPNGYDYFRRAGAVFVEDDIGVDEITDINLIPDKPKEYPLAAKEAWLQRNAKAFQLLREGLKYPALHKPMHSNSYPEFKQYRQLARALLVESHVRAERGDWNDAVQSALDTYQFGSQIAHGGSLIVGMMGVAIRGMSLRELGNLLPHTNATTARRTAASVEKYYTRRYPYYKTLQQQKWSAVAEYAQIMRQPSWRVNLMHDLNHSFLQKFGLNTNYLPSRIKNAQILVISKRKVISDMTRSMDGLIENARQPYAKQVPVDASGNPLVDTMLPVYKRARWNWARYDTFTVGVMMMYALRAYKIDNGHYPENLNALVPIYLPKIPIDPYDGVAPIQYQLRGNKYLLWSIGPDGIDNHGKPIINPNKKGRARHLLLFPDSKGDVVAGINMP